MTAKRLPLVGAIAGLTLLSYFFFPGHTYLQQDSQIYVPILEHLWDQNVLAQDPIAVRHHVTFTVYDEVALGLRRLTGLGFQDILVADQLVSRTLGLLGVYLIGTALGLSSRMALLVAAVFGLGATIAGPSVLTVEYEPKPRTSAIPFSILAVGLVAHGRYLAAGCFGALSFLYHPPSAYPFWGVYFLLTLWPSRPEVMSRRIRGLLPLACAAVLLLVFSRMQIGGPEPQTFFGKVDPNLEQLQRMRASYNWISVWISRWLWHYLFLWGVSIAAFWRLRREAPADLQFFLAGLPLVGILSVPASYLLLEQWKWSLMPKFQPARALLFLVALAVIGSAAAGLRAARQGRLAEAMVWCVVAFAVPVHTRVLDLLWPDLGNPVLRRRALVVLILAGLACLSAWVEAHRRRWAWAPWVAAAVAPFILIPSLGRVSNYPSLDLRELHELAAWARERTPRDAVFLFPDNGRDLYPGIFRSRALRAVYVDWKGGGQVNTVKEFGEQWWARWQQAMQPNFDPSNLDRYAALGIDYLALKPANRLPSRIPEHENSRYIVYRIR